MKRGKQGQIKLSFGMIFSIILIIIFLAFAFYAIKVLLGLQSTAQTGKFVSDLQADVSTAWRSTQSSQSKEYFISKKIERVCFVDFSISGKGENSDLYSDLNRANYGGGENLVFYPVGSSDIDSVEIEHLDIDTMTATENPYCIDNIDGKIDLRLEKENNEVLVTITR